jgi:hypothetical protein
LGVERIECRFAEISAGHDGRGLVLLCYEPVGQPCHWHLFSSWFEQGSGQDVPELEDQQLEIFGRTSVATPRLTCAPTQSPSRTQT